MRTVSHLINLFCSLVLLSLAINAYAECNVYTPLTTVGTQSPMTVTRSLANGGTIGQVSFSGSSGSGSSYMICYPAGTMSFLMGPLFTTPSGISGVYNTNLPGVGIKLESSGNLFQNPANTVGGFYGQYGGAVGPVTLVKTGPITSGIVSSGIVGTIYGDDRKTAVTYEFTGNKITYVPCTISTSKLTFPIGDVQASSFGSSVGTIPAGAENIQNLKMACDAGTNIVVSLIATQNPDVGTQSVIALTGQGSAGVASGVGVQILYNGSPLLRNTPLTMKQSVGGQEIFPLTARYYQTRTTVTPGVANASATLDVTYQ